MKSTLLLPFLFGPVFTISSPPLQQPFHHLNKPSTHTLLSLHKSLVQTSSTTYNETAAIDYLTTYLLSQNLTVTHQSLSPTRSNIHAYIGTNASTHTLLTSHIDTVPPYIPYHISHSTISGRGSVDAKGSVASQITAFLQLRDAGEISEGDVGLLYVVGEETGGDGMRFASAQNLTFETAIFGEPTRNQLACGHKGLLGVQIYARGKAGHSGYPELGRSANDMLIEALGKLRGVEFGGSKKFGPTTVNVGRIEGGVAANVIAERAKAELAIRIGGGTLKGVKEMVEGIVEGLGYGEDMWVEFVGGGYEPVQIDCDVEGFETLTVNYGTDIPNLKGDYKRYLYGPGDILVAHSDHEHLEVADLEEAVEGYKKLVRASLKK